MTHMTHEDEQDYDLLLIDFAADHGYPWEITEIAMATVRQEREHESCSWQSGAFSALLNACQEINNPRPRPSFSEIEASRRATL